MKNMPTEAESNQKYLKLRNNFIALLYINLLVFDIFCILYLIFL